LQKDLELNIPSWHDLKAIGKKYDEMLEVFENSKGVFILYKIKILQTNRSMLFL
jgi:hypothetical protein